MYLTYNTLTNEVVVIPNSKPPRDYLRNYKSSPLDTAERIGKLLSNKRKGDYIVLEKQCQYEEREHIYIGIPSE